MKNKNTIITLISFSLTLAIIVALAVGTYAYVRVNKEQERYNVINTIECLNLSISSVSSNGISLSGEYPIKNSEGMTKTPYTFKITNACSKPSAATVNLEVLSSSTLVNDYSIRALVTVNGENISDTSDTLGGFPEAVKTSADARSSYTIYSTNLSIGETKTLDLRIWLDEDATSEELGKTFNARLAVSA